jgi:AAHS family 4-hydroxybenzoate transporter-like MFS transporter
MAIMPSREINAATIIDRASIGSFHWQVLLICLAVATMDGFDTQTLSYAAPALVRDWGIQGAALAPALSAGVLGMMLGSMIFGPLADRFGRRSMIVVCLVLFGVFSFLTPYFTSLPSLIVMRVITGLGIGGSLPNAVALGVEYFPRRRQAMVATYVVCGYTVGAAGGGFVAAALIPQFGWPSVFYAGGLLPVVLIPLVMWGLPESVRLLILWRRPAAQVGRALSKIDTTTLTGSDITFALPEENQPGVTLKHLFASGRAFPTLMIWTMYFFSMSAVFLVNQWTPLVLNSAGVALQRAVLAGATIMVGAVLGSLAIGPLMDRFNSYKALANAYFLAALTVLAMMFITGATAFPLILAILFSVGFMMAAGGIQGASALAGMYYPTFIRSTGIGWGFGFGRLGAIAGTMLGGALIAAHWNFAEIFFMAAPPLIVCCVAVLAMYWRVSSAKLDGSAQEAVSPGE